MEQKNFQKTIYTNDVKTIPIKRHSVFEISASTLSAMAIAGLPAALLAGFLLDKIKRCIKYYNKKIYDFKVNYLI